MPNLKQHYSKGLITIAWDRSIESAYSLMREKQIRHLGVTNEFGTVYGILSERDVARAMDPQRQSFPEGAVVCNYLSCPVLTARQDANIADIAELMINEKISSILVIGANDTVLGIITSDDLLRVLTQVLRTPTTNQSLKLLPYSPVLGELLKELGAAGI